jgi:hypothetical protein
LLEVLPIPERRGANEHRAHLAAGHDHDAVVVGHHDIAGFAGVRLGTTTISAARICCASRKRLRGVRTVGALRTANR